MKTQDQMISTRSAAAALLLCLVVCSCKKKDDDATPITPPIVRSESFTMTVNGTAYSGGYTSKQFDGGQQYLDVIADCGGDVLVEFESLGGLSPGNYPINSSTSTRGFGVSFGSTAYYCTDCTVNIETHDTAARYFLCKVNGTITKLIGSGTRTLNEARISVFY